MLHELTTKEIDQKLGSFIEEISATLYSLCLSLYVYMCPCGRITPLIVHNNAADSYNTAKCIVVLDFDLLQIL